MSIFGFIVAVNFTLGETWIITDASNNFSITTFSTGMPDILIGFFITGISFINTYHVYTFLGKSRMEAKN